MEEIKSVDYFAQDENFSAGWVYEIPNGTEKVGDPRPAGITS